MSRSRRRIRRTGKQVLAVVLSVGLFILLPTAVEKGVLALGASVTAATLIGGVVKILLLIAYIQPFADGNKRTSRLMSNAQLIANGVCPLSFRTAEANDYRAALLLFYEQNNVSAFKRMFLEQVEFAVKEYF